MEMGESCRVDVKEGGVVYLGGVVRLARSDVDHCGVGVRVQSD